MTRLIEFIEKNGPIPKEYYPEPAKKGLPDWYKSMSGHTGGSPRVSMNWDGSQNISSTLKKCMPLFDGMTAGYLVKSFQDVQTNIIDDRRQYVTPEGGVQMPSIQVHFMEQTKDIPVGQAKKEELPKWLNPWGIRTPSGYSCLLINPIGAVDSPFKCFEAIVDTDTFIQPINFPFHFIDPDWEGLIPAGTPLMQVIPFRRDAWKMDIKTVENSPKTLDEVEKALATGGATFFNRYKNKFWSPKKFN